VRGAGRLQALAAAQSQNALSEEQLKEVAKVFEALDKDRTGSLSLKVGDSVGVDKLACCHDRSPLPAPVPPAVACLCSHEGLQPHSRRNLQLTYKLASPWLRISAH
jgi:hypothetical protein